MKSVSLFSGIGGFDLGFQRAGIECVAVCEIDKNAQSVLRRRFPKAQLFDDVRKIGKETHERKSIDLVCGGFPCQDISIAGKRAGLAGERSGLWFEFARVIDELEPQWVVVENVPGLLSSNGGRDFAIILGGLTGVVPSIPDDGWKTAGIARGWKYNVVWRVLDAQYFGVPQRRRRVFIVGSFGNGRAAEVLFESESGAGNNPPIREAGKEVAYSLRANPSRSGDKGDGGINTTMVAQTLTSGGNGHRGYQDGVNMALLPVVMAHGQANAEIVSDGSPSLTMNHEAPIAFGWNKSSSQTMKVAETTDALQASPTSNPAIWEMSHASEAVRENGEVAPTLQARMGTGGNQVPMVGVRRLMPVECERLQGFPDGWTDGQADSSRYKQLGNAVAVPVAEWIGKRIMAATRNML